MAISESVQICEALDILLRASKDELEPYWIKAEKAFQKLRKQMRQHNTKKSAPAPTQPQPPIREERECVSSPTSDIAPTAADDSHSVTTSSRHLQDLSGQQAIPSYFPPFSTLHRS